MLNCGNHEQEVHQRAVKQLAEFTSAAIAMYHKIGQLLLVEASVPLLAYKFRSLSIAGYVISDPLTFCGISAGYALSQLGPITFGRIIAVYVISNSLTFFSIVRIWPVGFREHENRFSHIWNLTVCRINFGCLKIVFCFM
jgi:hypothetical protein